MKKVISVIAAVMLVLIGTSLYAGDIYVLDVAHSKVGFSVKHMMISNVEGNFGAFEGTIEFDGKDITTLKANISVDVASINTNNADRDNHLKSPDFFDAANHPKATFVSKKVVTRDGKNYLIGDLTIRGVTREVEIEFVYNGKITDPWGNTRIGFEANANINRKDFGVSWSKVMDNGGLVVGDEVRLILHVEAVLKK